MIESQFELIGNKLVILNSRSRRALEITTTACSLGSLEMSLSCRSYLRICNYVFALLIHPSHYLFGFPRPGFLERSNTLEVLLPWLGLGLSSTPDHQEVNAINMIYVLLFTFELPELELPLPELSWEEELSRTDLNPA